MAHYVAGAPLLVTTSNGALCPGAPLVCLAKKNLLLMAHRLSGAPLVSFTLMAHQHMVRHCYIAMAHHMSGAPLVAIPSIALFLVVTYHERYHITQSSHGNMQQYDACYDMAI